MWTTPIHSSLMQRGYYHNTQPRSGPSKRCSITARYLSSRPSRVLQIFLLHLLSCEQIEKGFFNIVSMLINAFVEVFLLECRSAFFPLKVHHIAIALQSNDESDIFKFEAHPVFFNLKSLPTIIVQLHQNIEHSSLLDYKFNIFGYDYYTTASRH